MKASRLIKLLQKSIEEHGDKKVWVDCTNEGLSSSARGVYYDTNFGVTRIGDEDFREIRAYVNEEGEGNPYFIIKE